MSEYEELGLPWSCGGFAFPSAGRVTRAVWTRIPEGKQSGTRLTEFIDRDKAEYIEKSANAFPKLVRALQMLRHHTNKCQEDAEWVYPIARDALALVEEVE